MDDVGLLRKLDLTEYESRTLLALISLGPASVREIVLESKIPKNKAYETLKKLESKGFIATLPITPRKYKIENFEKLNDIIMQKKKDLDLLEKNVERFKKSVAKNPREYKEFFWVIKGQKAIQEKLRANDEHIHKEILSVHRLTKYLPQNLRTMRTTVERGVHVRMLCVVEKDNYENVLRWRETGVELRVYNKKLFGELMPRFSVFDQKTVIVTIGTPEISDGNEYLSLWTESPALAQVFRNYFLTLWEHALPIDKELKKFL